MLRFYRLARGCCTLGIGVPFGILVLCLMISSQREAREESRRARNPVSISIEEFTRKPPRKGWYQVTGTLLDLREAVLLSRPASEDDSNRVSYVLIAAHASPDTDTLSSLAVYTSNDDIRAHLSELIASSETRKKGQGIQEDGRKIRDVGDLIAAAKKANGPKAKDWLHKYQDALVQQRTVTGKVVPADELDENQQKLFHFDSKRYASDAVVLIEGAHPEAPSDNTPIIVIIVILLVFGVLVGCTYLYLGIRTARN